MNKITVIRLALITVVCGCVFAVSAGSEIAVAVQYGIAASWVYPVCIDGMILVSALTLVARTGVNRTCKAWARFGRYFGFAATIYANGAHSQWASTDAIIVNSIPAIALIVVIELLITAAKGTGRRSR